MDGTLFKGSFTTDAATRGEARCTAVIKHVDVSWERSLTLHSNIKF